MGAGVRRSPRDLQAKKTEFLALYGKGELTLQGAARRGAGVDQSTIWQWRQQDPVFDTAVKALQVSVDGIRVAGVEDSLYQRCVKGEATAAETIFFLCNRAPERWRHVARVEHTGAGGGPMIYEFDLSQATEEDLAVLEGSQ